MFLSALVFLISSEAHPYSVEITKENVFDIIGKKDNVYVHFYAEGCRHCAKMAPEWNELVRIYHPVKNVIMATINCDRWSNLCFSFDGTSTPSIQHFKPRERQGTQYGGEKTLIPMAKWIISTSDAKPYTKPHSLLYIKSMDEVNDILKDGQVFLVVDDPKNQFYNQTEIRQCEDATETKVLAMSNKDFPDETSAFCGEKEHCIVFINQEKKVLYEGQIDSSKIIDFLESYSPKDESL